MLENDFEYSLIPCSQRLQNLCARCVRGLQVAMLLRITFHGFVTDSYVVACL